MLTRLISIKKKQNCFAVIINPDWVFPDSLKGAGMAEGISHFLGGKVPQESFYRHFKSNQTLV